MIIECLASVGQTKEKSHLLAERVTYTMAYLSLK